MLHLPTGVIDRRPTPNLASAKIGQRATLRVKVVGHTTPKRFGRAPYRIHTQDETGNLDLLFFNHGKWIEEAFPLKAEVVISGTVEGLLTEKQIIHPEILGEDWEEMARICPTYPLTASVTQNMMGKAMRQALAVLDALPPQDWLTDKKLKMPSLYEALKKVHNPLEEKDLSPHSAERCRLALDELFTGQYTLLKARQNTQQVPGIAHKTANPLQGKFIESLPFPLTCDQQKAIAEIDADMASPLPMLRLVQGDVGSGKTVVAFVALLRAVASGKQGVLMAPTEILATQHYENAQKILNGLGVSVGLLTGKLTMAEKRQMKAAMKAGEIDLIIGTHALVQKDVALPGVGLVVIDEQHRFGVMQRLHFHNFRPDVLVMSATPIPRTMALTMYGDMDISIIQEKPPGRTPIKTRVKPVETVSEIAKALGRVLKQNQQIYWVCPLVAPQDDKKQAKLDLTAATERFDHLQKLYGKHVALLHGKMKSAEKEEILAEFRAGKTKILVSTTVIEVGIDVPQATTMVIEHAERFGLAQLHQLRGRVGRGALASTCLLLYATPLSEYAAARLQTMRESEDGFYLAEKDLELRGPGEILGTKQAGQFVTHVANLAAHQQLIPEARRLAKTAVDEKETPAIAWICRAFQKDDGGKLLKSG